MKLERRDKMWLVIIAFGWLGLLLAAQIMPDWSPFSYANYGGTW